MRMNATEDSPSLRPSSLARLGGLLYLVMIAAGLFRELYVKSQIFVAGDVEATANRLQQMEFLWRTGIAAELVMVLCGVVLTWVLYILLKPVNRHLSLLMAFFSLTALAVETAVALLLVQALLPMTASYMDVIEPGVRHGLVGMTLRAHEYGFGIALLMFGPYFLVTGLLIWRSRLFPKVVGVLYQISGVGYLAHGIVLIVAPAVAATMFMFVALPIFIGELTFCLWLLFRTFDETRWHELSRMHA
jgi:hypothetical protein